MSLVSDLPGVSGDLVACSPECFAYSDTTQPVEDNKLRKLNVHSCTSVVCRTVENKKGHQQAGWHWIFLLLHGQEKLTHRLCICRDAAFETDLHFFQYLDWCFSACKPVLSQTSYCLSGKERKGDTFVSASGDILNVFIVFLSLLTEKCWYFVQPWIFIAWFSWCLLLFVQSVKGRPGLDWPPEFFEDICSVGWVRFGALRSLMGPCFGGWDVVAQGFVHISCSMQGFRVVLLSLFLFLSSSYWLSVLHALKYLFLHNLKKKKKYK